VPTEEVSNATATQRSGKGRKLLLFSLGALLLLAALALFALRFPHQILCLDSGEVKADALVLLGGGAGERPTRAAELFKAGVGKMILVSGAGDADDNRRMLIKRGVPPAAIQMERESKTTKENAAFSIPLLRRLGAKRVVIVTSWYHSRRALRCFQHYAPDIEFYSRPSYFAYDRSDWRRERTNRRIRVEYLKVIGYWFRYGVCPF
jgi:uncharacterized SAM-binding protein YcdF (DUF218 family)